MAVPGLKWILIHLVLCASTTAASSGRRKGRSQKSVSASHLRERFILNTSRLAKVLQADMSSWHLIRHLEFLQRRFLRAFACAGMETRVQKRYVMLRAPCRAAKGISYYHAHRRRQGEERIFNQAIGGFGSGSRSCGWHQHNSLCKSRPSSAP